LHIIGVGIWTLPVLNLGKELAVLPTIPCGIEQRNALMVTEIGCAALALYVNLYIGCLKL